MRLTPAMIAAFASVYLIWGSTYLAIAIAVETLPPLLLAGVRFLLAGGMLYAYTRLRGDPAPARAHWRGAAAVGGLLLLGGNGLVCWGAHLVPSGLIALVIASVPLWMTLLEWLVFRAPRPAPAVFLGLACGIAGVAVLVGPSRSDGSAVHPVGAAAILLACLSWSFGSLLSRRVSLPASPLSATAIEMLAGGAMLLFVGTALGEWPRFAPHAVSMRSFLAFAYLVVFGSLVAFSAYVWLLKHAAPSAVSTYAYVNPVVAVFLGWAFAGERIGPATLLAAGLIFAAVLLITIKQRRVVAPADDDAPRENVCPAEP